MSEKKKPTPGGNRGRAEAEKTTWRASISVSQDITVSGRTQGLISGHLLYGQRNALPLQHIMTLTNLDNRTARRLIERERRAGIPICSDNRSGYYLAENEAELLAFVRSMQHRAAEIMRTVQELETTLDEWTGQQRVDGW